MYIPPHFEELRIEVLHELVRASPLATLVTLSASGIVANHIPLYLSQEGQFGTLRGHIARSNPMWRDLLQREALAVFHGPESYISPSWYPTKREHGRAVPTWNYVAVHASGALRFVEDPDWLLAQLEALTSKQEAPFSKPWSVADAPRDFTEKLLTAIVGVEMVITKLTGKWKVSQNQPLPNRAGIIEGLERFGSSSALEMAALVAKASRE